MRGKVAILGAVAFAAALAIPVVARPALADPTFVLSFVGGAQAVEQQGYILNSTGCPWDPDDESYGLLRATLDPGQSASGSGCVIQDWDRHLLILTAQGVKGSASAFTVRLDYQIGAHLFTVSDNHPLFVKPVGGSGYYQTRQCLWAAYRDETSTEEGPVGNPAGGIGVRSTVTFTLTNTGSRRADFFLTGDVSPDLANIWPNSIALDKNCDPGTVHSINIDPVTGGVVDWSQPYVFWRP